MKLLFASLVTAIAVTFASCESLKTWSQSPETQAQIAALEQWAIAQAESFFAGNFKLGTKSLNPQKYSVSYAEQQAVIQAQAKFPSLSHDVIQAKVHAAFQQHKPQAFSPVIDYDQIEKSLTIRGKQIVTTSRKSAPLGTKQNGAWFCEAVGL